MKHKIAVIIGLFFPIFSYACQSVPIYKINFSTHTCIMPYKGYNYVTCHDMPVRINDLVIRIPENFKTDLASIPRCIWPIVAPARSNLMTASILHDYLYAEPYGLDRREIDSIFYNVLVDNGVDKTHAYMMYMAVRWFGGPHFNYAYMAGKRIEKLLKYDRNKVSEKWRYI